jgi:hypothetical protein
VNWYKKNLDWGGSTFDWDTKNLDWDGATLEYRSKNRNGTVLSTYMISKCGDIEVFSQIGSNARR